MVNKSLVGDQLILMTPAITPLVPFLLLEQISE